MVHHVAKSFAPLPIKDPSLDNFYAILHTYWGEQAGSQPDDVAEDDDDESDDGGHDRDGVEVVEPVGEVAAPAVPPMAPKAVAPVVPAVKARVPPPPKAIMPPPPVPARVTPETLPLPPASLNPTSLDGKSKEDIQAKIDALRNLALIYPYYFF